MSALKVSAISPPLDETCLTHFVAQRRSNTLDASTPPPPPLSRRALSQPLCSSLPPRHELCHCSQPKHLSTHMAASIKLISAMQLLQTPIPPPTHMHSCLFFQWFPRLNLTGMLAAQWGASRLWVFLLP